MNPYLLELTCLGFISITLVGDTPKPVLIIKAPGFPFLRSDPSARAQWPSDP